MSDLEYCGLFYILTGLATYPAAIDMWYRRCFIKKEFPCYDGANWYFGFLVFVLFWPIAFPVNSYQYLKDIWEHAND